MWGRIVAVIAVVLVAVLAMRACAPRSDVPSTRVDVGNESEQLVLEARVTRAVDGDTVDVELDSGPMRVRLHGANTPERGQALYSEAADALRDLVQGGEVVIEPVEQDRYGRMVGRVYAGDDDVGAELIKLGMAYADRRYLGQIDGDESYCEHEHAARQAKLGLWALPAEQRGAPWEWLRGRRESFTDYGSETVATCVAAIGVARPQISPFDDGAESENDEAVDCGSKRTCEAMVDCAEATRFLKQCGLPRDGDEDGIPCETSVCR